MAHPVVLTEEARDQVRAVRAWWRQHRPAAPTLFADELAAALRRLSAAPSIGRGYSAPGLPGVRRVPLRVSRYHVYYAFDGDVVAVLAVWSSLRGHGPPLPTTSPSG